MTALYAFINTPTGITSKWITACRRLKKTSSSALCVRRRHVSPYMQNIFNYQEVRQEGRVGLRGEEGAKVALRLDTRTGEITPLA